MLAAWALFCLLPILWFLSIGFRPRTEIITPQPIYWPTFSLDAWHMIWDDWPMGSYLRNSLLAIVGSVIIDLVLAIPAAYSLARYDYKGREDIGFYILSTRMMAPAIVAIPIFFLFKNVGLLDTVWGLMLVYAAINLSLVTWIIRSYMQDIPHELEDAARTDGASDLRILWEIIIPDLPAGDHHRCGHRGNLRDQRVPLHAADRLDKERLHHVGGAGELHRRIGRQDLQRHRPGLLPGLHVPDLPAGDSRSRNTCRGGLTLGALKG